MTEPSSRRRVAVGARLVVGSLFVLALVLPSTAAFAAPWYVEGFAHGETDVFGGPGWLGSPSGHVGRGLYTELATGSHYGANTQLELSDLGLHDRDELYWRYWLRLDPDFHVAAPYRGKLPGPAGLYSRNCRGGRPSTVDRPCWSARTMFSRDSYPSPSDEDYVDTPHRQTLLGTYVYHLDSPDNRGDILTWNAPAGLVDHGRWHCVEGRLRMNTPGAGDGIIQNWVDGDQAFDRRDFRFRRGNELQVHIKSWWNTVYYGGSGTSPRDNDVWLDSLVLSPHRVGCGSEPDHDFIDHVQSLHRANIDWLAARGITRGCNPPDNDRFCPGAAVSRAEMAVFLTRALELPAVGGNRFRDDDGSVYEDGIEALAAAGVTRGCNPPANDRFCPDAPTTRGEMAAFLARGWDLPDGASNQFTDVGGSRFRRDIGAMGAAGVTRGCNPPDNDRYCPGAFVTRAEMATFLRRVAVRFPPPS